MPARAIGVKWLTVDPGARKLAVSLGTVDKTQPRQTLSIPVSVTGLPPATDAYVMVAAVDLGILNLTNYKAPDPEAWFFGQRQLGLELRDLYGRLIDGSLGATGKLRTGGDGAQMTANGSPPTEKLVAFFSGPVRLDADGKATIDFDIPQFNGTVRVMTVAWTKDAVGHATSDVIVRDPIVVTASLPRFLTPGDKAELRLDIANTDGPAGDYTLSLDVGRHRRRQLPGQAARSPPGKRQTLTVPISADETGDAGLTIRLASADGLSARADAVDPGASGRPAGHHALRGQPRRQRRQPEDRPRSLLAASLLDGAFVSVGVSQSAAFDVPSLLMTLDRYPYGCAEQTTSRAMPLLYVSELSKAAGLPEDPDLHDRIQDAIYRVLNYQSSTGSFGLWSPGSGDHVARFLCHRLPDPGPRAGLRRAARGDAAGALQPAELARLRRRPAGALGEVAYALYVLARNHKASIGDLRYYADTQIDEFDSPMARAQLAASLALYGDAKRAEATFASALSLAMDNTEVNYYRTDYGSQLRDGAAMLALAAETKPMPAAVPAMIRFVAAARARASYTSTQDEAWMLLAARAIKQGNEGIQLTVNGSPHAGPFCDPRHRRRAAEPADHHRQPERRSGGGGGHDGRGTRPAIAGRRQRLHRSSAPTTSSTAARRTSPRRRRTSVTWSCSRSTSSTTGRRACWSTTCCRPASRSTIRGSSTAPT